MLSYGNDVESSFLELRCKEVVNIVDGRRLGHIIDLVFDLATACILGIVVPGEKSGWNVFKNNSQLFIPFPCIVKIGEDAILVQLQGTNAPTNPYILSQQGKTKDPPKQN